MSTIILPLILCAQYSTGAVAESEAPSPAANLAHDCFTSGEAEYSIVDYFWSPSIILHGHGAFALGVDYTCFALYLHFHYFWAFFPSLEPIRWLITRISLIGVVAATIFVLLYIASHPNTPKAPNLQGVRRYSRPVKLHAHSITNNPIT
jgi:hypothetical protein